MWSVVRIKELFLSTAIIVRMRSLKRLAPTRDKRFKAVDVADMNDAGSRCASSKADKAERGRRPGFRVGASGQKQSGGSLVAVRGLLMGSGRV